MRNIFILLLLLSSVSSLFASTNITTPTVSGHWIAGNSPYLIHNNVLVDSGHTLVIDPGVEVIFQGPYAIDVAGMLCATGTATKPILFHVQDTTGWSVDTLETGGWHGIHFLIYTSPVPDTSSFQYCHVYDMKSLFYSTTLVHFYSFRSITIRNCDFHHNMSQGNGGCVHITYDPPMYMGSLYQVRCEVSGCQFYNNIGNINGYDSTGTPARQLPGSVLFLQGCTPAIIKNNTFQNNEADRLVYILGDSAIITGNKFTHNVQTDTSVGNVSLIDFVFSVGVFKNNIVNQNTTYYDAMLCSNYSYVDINSNIICNNRCTYNYDHGYCFVAYGGSAIRLFNETVDDSILYRNIVRNNIIANNFTGTYGSAIYDYGVDVKVVNNTIVNNNSLWGNTIYFNYSPDQRAKIIIKNNIIYGNNGNLSLNNWGGYLEINHNWLNEPLSALLPYPSTFASLNPDTFNVKGITAKLVSPTLTDSASEDALAANFNLLVGSPCIHSGDTTRASADSTDYAGKSRLTSGKIDIGAYQYHTGVLVENTEPEEVIGVYPNPAAGYLYVNTPDKKGSIQISDISGRIIMELPVTNSVTRISLQQVSTGVYFATLISDGEKMIGKKFIVR